METWILFIDFVKAFDGVPRHLLWRVLKKFGVPPKLIRLLTSLHDSVHVNFETSGITKSFRNTIGVKQGDTLGPLLFTFYIAAIFNSWRETTTTSPCIFKTSQDFKLTGRNHKNQGELFLIRDSEYADDAAAIFGNRSDLSDGAKELISHCRRFGMEVHTGINNAANPPKKSKSEALFVPKPAHSYNDPATFDNANLAPIDTGNSTFIPIVSQFNYLGSHQSQEATDSLDVKERIKIASSAFGSLRKMFFNNRNILPIAKSAVYKRMILPIALYASESWCLTSKEERALETFQNSCTRTMSSISRRTQHQNYISSHTLRNRLGIPQISSSRTKHQLRWAGHVARMKWHRLPRKLLSSWCNNKRPSGSPQMTYGRSLHRATTQAGITRWHRRAQDKIAWKRLINNIQ